MSNTYDFKRLLVESGIISREAARQFERWGDLEPGTADGAGQIVFERPTQGEIEEAFTEFGEELHRLLKHRPAPPPGATNVNPDNKPVFTEVPHILVEDQSRVEILEDMNKASE